MNPLTQVLIKKPKRSLFPQKHDRKMSFKFGELVPTTVIEMLPGDTWASSPETLLRMAPLVAPTMHKVDATTHYFFVPNRIVWNNWEKFITDPDSGIEHPYIENINGFVPGSIADYMGLPTETNIATENEKVNAIPFAAYFKIYDDWYRDQHVGEPILIDTPQEGLGDGNNSTIGGNSAALNASISQPPPSRSWARDYFTGAGQTPTFGVDIAIPIFKDGDGVVDMASDYAFYDPTFRDAAGNNIFSGDVTTDAVGRVQVGTTQAFYEPKETLVVPASEAGTIKMLREAIERQHFYEKQAYSGGRYNETVKAHFGANLRDARINRPELIGTVNQTFSISEVLSTAETVDAPIGQMAGHGISAKKGRTFKYTAPEHGYIIGIISVRPKTAYQQGIPRHFSRQDFFDYCWPNFQNVGEQAILMKELYTGSDITAASELDEVFAYQRKYAEYMTTPSSVHGDFRTTLNYWTMSRIFTLKPQLNYDFLAASKATTRIFADETGDHIWAYVMNNTAVTRPLAKYTLPGAPGAH
jgi:hypothetical protein